MLDGLPVLDLTDHRGQVGPWLLAELGAEVIRIQTPFHRPDPEAWDHQGIDLAHWIYSAGKTVTELDPSVAADRRALGQLITEAAVVVDCGPPGYLAAFGLGRAELIELNPAIVSVVVTPFGADGPRADQPASELTVAALGGPVRIQGTRERAPVHHSVPQTWRHAGAEAAVASLVALARSRTDGPQFVDVSAQSVMTWTMLNAMEAFGVQGHDFERTGATLRLALETPLRHGCTDGFVILAIRGPNGQRLAPWLIEEGIVDARWLDENWTDYDANLIDGQDTVVSYPELIEAVTDLCSRYPKAELMRRGAEIGVTIAPVNDVVDLLAFDHLDQRGFWRAGSTSEMSLDGSDRLGPGGLRYPGSFLTVDGRRPETPRRRRPEGDAGRVARPPMFVAGGRATTVPEPDPNTALPFEGLVVADFSWIGVGPITAKCFADHGATVVRVESTARLDGLRHQPPFKDGQPGHNRSNFFGAFNTSKLGLTVDLKNEGGLRAARRLVERADVVIDSFTPGSMERLGLGPSFVQSINPRAITVTTSLLGSGGPYSTMAGYGYHAAAIAGFFDLVGWPDLPPDGPWLAYTDTVAPRFITTSLLAALDRRARTGRGCHIEVAQLECALQLLAPEMLGHQLDGRVPRRRGNRAQGMAPQGIYPCSGDDCWAAISVVDDEAWCRFRAVLGEPAWSQTAELDTVAGRLANHDAIDAAVAVWTSARTECDVERELRAAGIAVGVVQRSRDLLADPQYQHRGFYRLLEHAEVGRVPYAGHQYRIEGYDHGPRTASPALGQHTFEVLTELLGFDTDEVAEIAATGGLE